MRESDTKTFSTTQGTVPLQVVQLPAIRASKLLIKLLDTVGPGVAALAQVVKTSDGKSLKQLQLDDLDMSALPVGVSALFDKLDGDKFEALLLELLTEATVMLGGQNMPLTQAQINVLFRGHVLELFRLFLFAIRVNYADFFGGLGGLAKLAEKLTAKMPGSNSQESNTSSGPGNG